MSDLAKKALELSGKATPGPWRVGKRERAGEWLLQMDCDRPEGWAFAAWVSLRTKENGEFIAFSREALPALAEEVMRLREALAKAAENVCNYAENYLGLDEAIAAELSAVVELGAHIDAALASRPEKE